MAQLEAEVTAQEQLLEGAAAELASAEEAHSAVAQQVDTCNGRLQVHSLQQLGTHCLQRVHPDACVWHMSRLQVSVQHSYQTCSANA